MSGRLKRVRVLAALLAVGLLFAAATAMPAMAASHEQIVDMCRQAMHPQIMACALAKGLRGNPEAVRQQCGAPLVRPCVMRAEAKQAAGVAAPAAPKKKSRPRPLARRRCSRLSSRRRAPSPTSRPSSTARNRTPRKSPSAKPTPRPRRRKNASPSALAQFYYDRGNARALLARNKDALADGLQALAAAKGGVEFRQLTRIRQFVSLQYRELGDPKDAIAMSDLIVRDGNPPGTAAV